MTQDADYVRVRHLSEKSIKEAMAAAARHRATPEEINRSRAALKKAMDNLRRVQDGAHTDGDA